MQTLWLAIFLYSVGLAAVIHLRPALMFNENGTWKEFGYHRDSRHTLFPVWLFAIVWAIVSYAIAAAAGTLLAAGAPAAAAATTASQWFSSEPEPEPDYESEREEPETEAEEEEIAVPVSKAKAKNKPRKPKSGYYVLDPEQNTQSGLRRYIYYGAEPPTA
jgi:hypothetical protein